MMLGGYPYVITELIAVWSVFPRMLVSSLWSPLNRVVLSPLDSWGAVVLRHPMIDLGIALLSLANLRGQWLRRVHRQVQFQFEIHPTLHTPRLRTVTSGL